MPICGERRYLPSELGVKALAFETFEARRSGENVERALRCTLEQHSPEHAHHALAMELYGVDTGAVWARWTGEDQVELVKLLDCPGRDGKACNEYEKHPGAHSPAVFDPWGAWHGQLPLPPA